MNSVLKGFSISIASILLIAANSALAQGRPDILPEAANGQAAIRALGSHLPDVANEHGMTAAKLQELFARDESLWVDRSGRLFYIEEEIQIDESEPAAAESTASALSPADAFLLNSKPDSNRTIFLDFDGHTVSGTAWNSSLGGNSYNAPAFDLDGSPSTFSDAERNRIIGIWKRVAEDFAAFDVNVTTQDPGAAALDRSSSSDQVYGTRALITKRAPVCSGCGGVAYVGIFDSTNNSYYQPAWVFFDALGTGNEKYTAEAISHEVGHNVGLSHDGSPAGSYYRGHGSGETGWAPIMGVGYYKNLTQWSKGEYADANNTQDDYVVMANNGVAARSDDHGSSRSTATVLAQGSSFSASGIIETPADKDYFQFLPVREMCR